MTSGVGLQISLIFGLIKQISLQITGKTKNFLPLNFGLLKYILRLYLLIDKKNILNKMKIYSVGMVLYSHNESVATAEKVT